jgi:D-beta-D-heptose 7-phosphate kinase/D-beta-D-heptose 1-phosphate adenosyltransferase
LALSDESLASAQARIRAFQSARVLVLGDLMLDRFVSGGAERISPEAPVAVLAVEGERIMAGGAGNVARNIAALGGSVVLVGLVGDDAAGGALRDWLEREKNITSDLVIANDRPTTQKIRYVANRQQLLRVDIEKSHAAEAEADELLARFVRYLPEVQAVVLSDYGKGVLCDRLLAPAIAAARKAGRPIILDPKRADMRGYDGATVVTPNLVEAARASGVAGRGDDDVAKSAETLLRRMPATAALLVTRGPMGMTLTERGGLPEHFRATAREVFDVSGAGDTVVAGLALTLASGGTLAEGAALANQAAGLAVAKSGTATISAEELSGALLSDKTGSIESKILTEAGLAERLAGWRAEGRRIGFTNGCFDLIHPGHIALLERARSVCDRLIVGLNSDVSVRRLKGEARPVQDETARAIVLGSLAMVDAVILFGEDTPLDLIKKIRPDVLVKGADYRIDQIVGGDFVTSYGGRILLTDLVSEQSTTGTIARMFK